MDLLVSLYALPILPEPSGQTAEVCATVRRAMAVEKQAVVDWVNRTFGASASGWTSECEIAFSRLPISCLIAAHASQLVGFSCYDCTLKGFLGPMGVGSQWRSQGIGRRLLLATLDAMRAQGYGYAIVGNAGPVEFFREVVGAVEIPGSEPGVYADRVR